MFYSVENDIKTKIKYILYTAHWLVMITNPYLNRFSVSLEVHMGGYGGEFQNFENIQSKIWIFLKM